MRSPTARTQHSFVRQLKLGLLVRFRRLFMLHLISMRFARNRITLWRLSPHPHTGMREQNPHSGRLLTTVEHRSPNTNGEWGLVDATQSEYNFTIYALITIHVG